MCANFQTVDCYITSAKTSRRNKQQHHLELLPFSLFRSPHRSLNLQLRAGSVFKKYQISTLTLPFVSLSQHAADGDADAHDHNVTFHTFCACFDFQTPGVLFLIHFLFNREILLLHLENLSYPFLTLFDRFAIIHQASPPHANVQGAQHIVSQLIIHHHSVPGVCSSLRPLSLISLLPMH